MGMPKAEPAPIGKGFCPPATQVAAGEAKPGEVRAFDLPLVRLQAKVAHPSHAQWIEHKFTHPPLCSVKQIRITDYSNFLPV
jgi:hypothetical protein